MHLRHHLWYQGKEMEKIGRAWREWSVWSTAYASTFNSFSGHFTLLIPSLGHLKFRLSVLSTSERGYCNSSPRTPSHSHPLSSCHCYPRPRPTRHSVDPAVLHSNVPCNLTFQLIVTFSFDPPHLSFLRIRMGSSELTRSFSLSMKNCCKTGG